MIKLKHPDSKLTITVREDQTEVYASQGWKPVAEVKKDDPKGK